MEMLISVSTVQGQAEIVHLSSLVISLELLRLLWRGGEAAGEREVRRGDRRELRREGVL
jgi:hypothetical protein